MRAVIALFIKDMLKKSLIIFFALFFLSACGGEKKPPVPVPPDFFGPTSGPDPAKMAPFYLPSEEPADAFTLPDETAENVQ